MKYKNHILIGITALFAAYFVAALAGYVLVPAGIIPKGSTGNAAQGISVTQLADGVIQRNLFGIEERAPAPVIDTAGTESNTDNSSVGDIYNPTIPFDAKLTGITVDENGTAGYAILLDRADVYVLGLGQTVKDYTLVALGLYSATVRYRGVNHKLNLDNSTLGTAVNTDPQTPVRTLPPVVDPQPPTPPAGGNESVTISREELAAELKDISKIIGSLRIAPLQQNNELIGYRVQSINEDSLLIKYGLRAGDVINRVNGEDLQNPQVLFNMLNKADELTAVSIDITRSSEKKTLFVEITD